MGESALQLPRNADDDGDVLAFIVSKYKHT